MPLRRDTLRLSEDEVFGHEPGAPEEPPTDPLPPIAPPQVEGMGSLPLPGLIFEPVSLLSPGLWRASAGSLGWSGPGGFPLPAC
jgi:hypothetical protein